MQITFTLSPSYTGSTFVAGPFDISGTTSAGTSYWLATGVTKTELTTGYIINTIYETLTGGTINSTGTCSTSQNWYVTAPTPTPTPTATDGGSITSYEYEIEPTGESTTQLSCDLYTMSLPSTVWAASQFPNGVVQFFEDPTLSVTFNGSGTYHAYKLASADISSLKTAQVSPSGFVSNVANC